MKNWPTDADGDVLRRLEVKGFDFTQPCTIDFNVDFDQWPPCREAISVLDRNYPGAKLYGDDEDGYILFKIDGLLTYNLVIKIQAEATALVAQYGGRCESWGVLHK